MWRILFATLCVVSIACQDSDVGHTEAYFLGTGWRSGEDVFEFFSGKTNDDLVNLKHHSNCKVALPAAWILLRSQCLSPSASPGQISENKIEFLGYLSGRTNSPIPSWWKKQVIDIDFQNPADDRRLANWSTDGFTQTPGSFVWHSENIQIEFHSFRVNIIENDETYDVNFNQEYLNSESEELVKVKAACFTICEGGRRVLAVSSNTDAFIACYDRNNSLVWEQEIHSLSFLGGTGVEDFANSKNLIELVANSNEVVAYMASASGLKLIALNLENGNVKYLLDTSTRYPNVIAGDRVGVNIRSSQ